MAYKESNILDRGNAENQGSDTQTLQFSSDTVSLPHESYVRDADLSRDGSDLVMDGPQGTLIIEDYFTGLESPTLVGPSGASLTPELVNSFTTSSNEYAQSHSMTDASPVGAVDEISGNATITRLDGSQEKLTIGTPVFQGDVIETNADAAVNVAFIDDSSFAVSEETRLAIDEYVFDPSSQGGVQNFSVLKGVFVYTSGLIGREDPDDVSIDTPVGSIGIRGTIIAGDVDNAEITVIEGAIVLRDAGGNEMTLASQFETGKFLNEGRGIVNLGQKSAGEVAENFSKVSGVAPELFSSINDAANENKGTPQEAAQDGEPAPVDAKQPVVEEGQEFDANGATDKNGDSEVDGTVEEAPADAKAASEGEEAKEASLEEPAESEIKPTIQVIEDPLGVNQDALSNNPLGNTQTITATVANEAIDNFDNGNRNSNNGTGQKKGLLKKLLADQSDDNDSLADNLDDAGNVLTDTGGGGASNTAPEAKDLGDIGIPTEALSATNGYTMRFFAGEAFVDLDGDSLTFTLDPTVETYLNSQRGTLIDSGSFWDAGSGILTLSFLGSVPDGSLPTITIGANDGNGGFTSVSFDVNTVDADHVMSSGTNIPGSSGDITAIDGTVSLAQTNAAGVTIYRASSGLTQIGHNDTTFHGSTNNDLVDLSAAAENVTLYLEHGNDTVNIQTAQDNLEIYGMGGDETIQLSSTFLSHLASNPNAANLMIDGGHNGRNFFSNNDGDTLFIENTGGSSTVDFTAFNLGSDTIIKNIEVIDISNGGGGNSDTVALDFNSVFQMTDYHNELIIETDGSGDAVDLNAFDADTDVSQVGSAEDLGNGFDEYTFYHATDNEYVKLIIDSDATVTGI